MNRYDLFVIPLNHIFHSWSHDHFSVDLKGPHFGLEKIKNWDLDSNKKIKGYGDSLSG